MLLRVQIIASKMKNVLKDKVKLAVVVENYIGITTKLKTLPNVNDRDILHATGDNPWQG